MKKIIKLALLVLSFIAVTGVQLNAQTSYANVIVYTPGQHDIDGYVLFYKYVPNPVYLSQSWPIHFDASEGQLISGGYRYQKSIALSGLSFPYPATDSYGLQEIVSYQNEEKTATSRDRYAYSEWPSTVQMNSVSFIGGGGE
jgi:hypothetical protein